MTLDLSARFRRTTPAESRGLQPGSRFIDVLTGENISRRQRENRRLAAQGLPKLSVVQRQRDLGFPLTVSEEIALRESGLLAVWIRVWSDVRQEPTDLLDLSYRGRTSREGREFYTLIKQAMLAGEFIPGEETQNMQAPHMERVLEFVGLHNSQKSLELISLGTYDYPAEMNQRRRLVPLR